MLGVLGQAAQGGQDVGLLDEARFAKRPVDREFCGHTPGRAGWPTAGGREPGTKDLFVRHLNPKLHRVATGAGNAGVPVPLFQSSAVAGILRPLGSLWRYLA